MKKLFFSNQYRSWLSGIALLAVIFAGISIINQQPTQPLVQAQTTLETVDIELDVDLATETADATESAATESATASPSAEVEQRIQEHRDRDITEPTETRKSKLAMYLDENPPGPLSWNNFLQHAIRYAISEGVQPHIIVLILLFPLIASLIAASRHIIGLRGFGIYIPAVLSVALVSTGVIEGLAIFLAIVVTALTAKKLLRLTKLPYLPRTALLLWTISLGIFGVILIAPALDLVTLMSVNIFPILILVLLSENFLDAQARMKPTAALALALETIMLAVISGMFLKWEPLQRFALVEPELLIVFIGIFNVLIGKFVGLRLTERLRFRSLIEE